MAVTGAGCTVCRHPQVEQVNDWLGRGNVSRSSVSKRFDLSLDALRRHVDNDHAERVQAPERAAREQGQDPAAGPTIPPDASPRDKLVIVSDWLERRIASGKVRSEELREYRLTQKDIADMDTGAAPETVQITEVEGLEELLALVAEALEPHPERRDWLAAELKRRGLPF